MPYKDPARAKARRKNYYQANREKAIERAADWAKFNRDRRKKIAREYYHRSKFSRSALYKARRRFYLTGWLPEDYEAALKIQDGKCAICKAQVEMLKYSLHADHNHTTGKKRGLLCKRCNIGLGHFRENVEILRKAIAYLEYHDGSC